MKKKQILNQLVAGQQVSEILFAPILMHFAARQIGKTYGEFASDYRVLVDANVHAVKEFGMDIASLISDPYRETSAFGAEIEFIDEGVPICKNHVITTPEEIKNLEIPDPLKKPRTLDRILAGRELSRIFGDDIPIGGWIEGPLAESADLAGVSEILMMLMMDPENTGLLMDKCLEFGKKFARAQIEAGCALIGMGDAISSQIDLGTYDQFVKERHKEIISFIHENGALFKLHICGNITHLLPSIKDIGADIIDLDWQVDINEARGILGPDPVICGNINPVTVQDKTPEEVYKISRDLLDSQKGKKFILSAGCEITVDTPVENLLAMKKAAEES